MDANNDEVNNIIIVDFSILFNFLLHILTGTSLFWVFFLANLSRDLFFTKFDQRSMDLRKNILVCSMERFDSRTGDNDPYFWVDILDFY